MDVPGEGVGYGATVFDELHRVLGSVALRDENARAHCGSAVTTIGAMSVDFAAALNRFEGGLRAEHQIGDGDREEGTVDRAEPQGVDRLMVGIERGSEREAHVDDESDAKFAQAVVVALERHVADKQVVGDLGDVHARNRIIIFSSDQRVNSCYNFSNHNPATDASTRSVQVSRILTDFLLALPSWLKRN